MGRKEKKAKKKGKVVRKGRKHETTKQNTYYTLSGGSAVRSRKSCPRCGPGTWLASHKGRLYCGRCSYTEFEKRVEAPVAVQKPETKPEIPLKASPETPPETKPEKPTESKPKEDGE